MNSSLFEYLNFFAKDRPEVMFAQDDEISINYAQALEFTNNAAYFLQKQGLVKGDRVAVVAKNSVNHALLLLACAKLGVVAVEINYRLTPKEWCYIVENSQAKMSFVDAEYAELFVNANLGIKTFCIFGSTDICEHLGFSSNINNHPPIEATKIGMDDILIQMYTSGTTGLPKGVLLSHRNLIVNTYQTYTSTSDFPREKDRFLLIAPIYHIAGTVGVIGTLVSGVSMVIHRDFDPARMLEDLQSQEITGVIAVPVMLQFAIMSMSPDKQYDFSKLRTVTYGASPISAHLLKRCIEIFNCDFAQAYGQTESAGTLTILTPKDHQKAMAGCPELLRSCGRAAFGTCVDIVNEEGTSLQSGEIGEIVAKGSQVMQGYWQLEDANAKALKDGWLYTGDAGYMDENGYVFLCDRIKDIIISGGENIYPAEIENVVLAHEKIPDAAVIGVKDEKWGEVPLLIIAGVQEEDKISLQTLVEFCDGKLASFKMPKHIAYIDMLPRNPSGKILKQVLREDFKNYSEENESVTAV